MAKILNIVATICSPEEELRFNKWYDNVHIPLLMKYQGIKRVTRYRLVGDAQNATKYLACYEFDDFESAVGMEKSPEFANAMNEMRQSWPNGGFEIKWAGLYENISLHER